ncbi:ras-related protein Rab-20 isoform X2 [Dasypus novemcinctus]|uniref:ras-related protein Rab-20 isoform X2 n=2 Tax=Dasypus novemcinctus TaxID=9361 RepID=UPI00265E2FBA|nr:ras-related protein Rab-20 isoform X3 [Dasypus novemcinctus]
MVWQERRKAKRTSQQLSVFNSHAILSIKLRSPNPGQKARIASPATRTLSSGRKEVTQILAKKQTPARGRAGEGRRGGVGRPGRAPGLRRRGARGVRAAGAGGARGVRGGQGSPTWAPGRVSRPRPSALENALPLPSSWASGGEVPAGRPRASTARGLRGAGCPAPRAGVAPLRLGGPRGRAASRSCRCASRRRAGRAPGRGRARGAARRPGKLASGKMRKPDGKIVLLGDMNVGKTSLLHRYMERRFPDTVSTVGGAFYLKQWRSYNISIWDTAGGSLLCLLIVCPASRGHTGPPTCEASAQRLSHIGSLQASVSAGLWWRVQCLLVFFRRHWDLNRGPPMWEGAVPRPWLHVLPRGGRRHPHL